MEWKQIRRGDKEKQCELHLTKQERVYEQEEGGSMSHPCDECVPSLISELHADNLS